LTTTNPESPRGKGTVFMERRKEKATYHWEDFLHNFVGDERDGKELEKHEEVYGCQEAC
jgi:hypothetical protein